MKILKNIDKKWMYIKIIILVGFYKNFTVNNANIIISVPPGSHGHNDSNHTMFYSSY